jgi:hypothetical protein
MSASFKDIRVRSRDEFDWLIEHLTDEAYRARDNWDFWGSFEKACGEYSTELNQTPAFWELTRRAHQDILALRLGRLYDPHTTAASLGNLLQTMHDHMANPGTCFPPALKELESMALIHDISMVSDENPVVAKLLTLRNEYLAHRGKKHVQKGTFESLPTLDRGEIDALVENAIDLLRRYRERLGFKRLLWGHHEMEQFEELLSLLRDGMKARF